MKKEFAIASLWLIPFLTGCQGDVEKPKANEPVKVKAVVVKDDAYVNLCGIQVRWRRKAEHRSASLLQVR